jgi:ribosomal protein S18 acetylase RimI-like enzyme
VAHAAVPGGGAVLIRHAEPADYGRVIEVIDDWWGGRQMAAMLPKLFFVHFRDTSFVAEDGGALAGFLCGFRSQTFDDEAYVHFVGVDPARRGSGLGRELYERFFAAVAPRGVVRAVTAPVNERSVAFHRAIGFEVERVDENYDGRGQSRVLLAWRRDGR